MYSLYLTLAEDAPPNQFSLSRYYPSIKNTVKPVRANTPPSEVDQVLDLIYRLPVVRMPSVPIPG
jgi:trimethylamine---corrinoid protein Co-methyltransferase